ncbi:porin [Paraburkholderia saeva]|uniref:Outer membrane porin protein 32 n=1 Tax=Paraburkholderia saeva TaxID=2777537 RepID=A0A9N8X1X4_9BURK|nr:porin [Paraburkholderia saeva]CAG4896626.1 Outer membrane porin protein 32 [Paraburkholderia saeva]CAG4910743.1 Outer membrane porin protein 32 [Paraburkholderia saeva]
MKKRTVAIAALMSAFMAGSAKAQSSVTLFGVTDAALTHASGSLSNTTGLTGGGNADNRIGFKGTEDLGGGLKAGFWLESGFNIANGTGIATNTNNQNSGISSGGGLTFNRRSTVSIGGDWGEVRLGRDYTPQYWNIGMYDPFYQVGVGASQILMSYLPALQGGGSGPAVWASNSVSYIYNMPFNGLTYGGGGFYGQAMYYRGNNPSNLPNSSDGNGYGIRVGFIGANLTVAIAHGQTSYETGNTQQDNIGASYNFGIIKLTSMFEHDRFSSITANGFLVGATAPAGQGIARIAYSRYQYDISHDPSASKLAVGYVYPLSKRTQLYGTYAHVWNTGGNAASIPGSTTGPNEPSNGFQLGMTHSF